MTASINSNTTNDEFLSTIADTIETLEIYDYRVVKRMYDIAAETEEWEDFEETESDYAELEKDFDVMHGENLELKEKNQSYQQLVHEIGDLFDDGDPLIEKIQELINNNNLQ